ncbi:hypothetical protein LTR91_023133 [Friedmanniomyces endolithicus]|uniref:Uncharacterized protein n=1 Tax=Friedmanniomyces endolithicus TaxID=329885 RepID=A0AAN6H3M0_9PEZI|nr:hypothetical protein LTR94_010746 [Friedmanniomyces endolithicus]KAK0793169.1 hypothetical protein LTR38_009646 [Friedmanniomyces endolithicus]KAK0800931.1 hypothetical protein LTR75_008754 [Friedmanniomyces endolithicus]KAK0810984.1 hypothetical protein LTR59_001995 [Friedmanniomyces endolithicus]KAK0841632.1 hypothetical protein LTR03_009773 [Friedmanniomyces endolithicus]
MRSSIFIGPFMAAAVAVAQSEVVETLVSASGNTTVTTTISYSVPQTTLLTQTNSEGIITGQPVAATIPAGETASPVAITSQPAVATIPAGLPVGVTSLAQNASGTLSYFTVSVGSSTTQVIGGVAVAATGASTLGASGSASSAASGSTSATGSGSASAASATSGSGSSTASAAASSSTAKSAASVIGVQIASAGLIGLGALFAALL